MLKPNIHIRSECRAVIIVEYSFWCKRKTNIPVLNDISWEEVHYTKVCYTTNPCHFEGSEEVHTANISAKKKTKTAQWQLG